MASSTTIFGCDCCSIRYHRSLPGRCQPADKLPKGIGLMETKQLIAYQVGDNDIVAHYSPEQARAWLIEFANYAEDDIEPGEVSVVSDEFLDAPLGDGEGKVWPLRTDLANATAPCLLLSWE